MKAFTLLEIILALGILAILATAGFGVYFGFQGNVRVGEEADKIADILRQARSNAISGENYSKWGVRFVYPEVGESYYDLFWGESYGVATTTEKNYLPSGVIFASPTASSTLDVIFNRRSGSLTGASTITITVKNKAGDIVKNIIIESNGLIY